MAAAFAAVPVIGGAAFLFFAGVSVYQDWRLQQEEETGKKVLMRPWSKAAADPKRPPHWYLLASAVFYAPTIVSTVFWQQEVALQRESTYDYISVIAAAISGIAFFLMAVSPNFETKIVGSLWHALTAGAFLGTGAAYLLRAAFLALDVVDNTTLFVFRLVFTGTGYLGCAGMLFGTLYAYFLGDKVLYGRKPNENGVIPEPTAKEERIARLQIASLFVTQAMLGIAIGLTIISGVYEVSLMKGGWVIGASVGGGMFLLMLLLSVGAYTTSGSKNKTVGPSIEFANL